MFDDAITSRTPDLLATITGFSSNQNLVGDTLKATCGPAGAEVHSGRTPSSGLPSATDADASADTDARAKALFGHIIVRLRGSENVPASGPAFDGDLGLGDLLEDEGATVLGPFGSINWSPPPCSLQVLPPDRISFAVSGRPPQSSRSACRNGRRTTQSAA